VETLRQRGCRLRSSQLGRPKIKRFAKAESDNKCVSEVCEKTEKKEVIKTNIMHFTAKQLTLREFLP